MVLTDHETRALRALRAPGGISAEQAWERWPSTGSKQLHDLVKKGFAAHDGEAFTITEAGRAACPFRNPLLAGGAPGTVVPASQPKENTMPSRTDVFNAILSAGPEGIARKALAEKLGVSDNTIDNHVWHLCNADVPTVGRPQRGRLVASQFIDPAEGWVPETVAAPPVSAKADEFSLSIGAKPGDLPAVTEKTLAAVDSMLAALPPLGAGAVNQPRATGPGAPTVPDLVHIEDARLVEFAVFSTGGFEINTENGTVRLGRAALYKMRRFLGMFGEAV